MTQVRQPQDTFSSTVRIVLPNDTNTLGNLMGGNLLHWMDIAAAVSANRHCRRSCGDGRGEQRVVRPAHQAWRRGHH